MSFRIETYRDELVDRFTYYGPEEFTPEEARELIRTWAKLGPAFFGLDDEKVIAVAGFIELRWNNANVWGFFNPECRKYVVRIVKEIRSAIRACRYKSLLTVVKAGGRTEKFARLFLYPVGDLPNYGPSGEKYKVFYKEIIR